MKVVDHDNMTINLTNSSRQTFDACRRKFFYGNVLNGTGITLAGPHSEALLLGDIVHEMFAECLRGGGEHSMLQAGWDVLHKAEESVVYPTEKLTRNLFKARAMIPGLTEAAVEMRKKVLQIGDVKGVEETRSVHIGEVFGYSVMFHGKLDVILDVGNRLMVLDHKTVSAFKANFYDRCQFDPQLTGYALMLSPTPAFNVDYRVAYNCFRKPALRMKKGETEKEFGDRLCQYLVETDSDEYMKIIDTYRTSDHIMQLHKDLLELAQEILSCEDRNSWRQCTATCDIYAGCPYLMICAGTDDGSINYATKKSAHEELDTEDDW